MKKRIEIFVLKTYVLCRTSRFGFDVWQWYLLCLILKIPKDPRPHTHHQKTSFLILICFFFSFRKQIIISKVCRRILLGKNPVIVISTFIWPCLCRDIMSHRLKNVETSSCLDRRFQFGIVWQKGWSNHKLFMIGLTYITWSRLRLNMFSSVIGGTNDRNLLKKLYDSLA